MSDCTCKEPAQIFHCAECKTETPITELLGGDDCPICKYFTGGRYIRTICPIHKIPTDGVSLDD